MAKTITFDTVRQIGRALPDVEEGTAYGSPALKVGGAMFTCIAINRSAEPDTLAVRVPFGERDELIAAEPGTYYLTDHYVDYACVLVRLGRIHHDALVDLLRMSHAFVAANARRSPGRRRARGSHGPAARTSRRASRGRRRG